MNKKQLIVALGMGILLSGCATSGVGYALQATTYETDESGKRHIFQDNPDGTTTETVCENDRLGEVTGCFTLFPYICDQDKSGKKHCSRVNENGIMDEITCDKYECFRKDKDGANTEVICTKDKKGNVVKCHQKSRNE